MESSNDAATLTTAVLPLVTHPSVAAPAGTSTANFSSLSPGLPPPNPRRLPLPSKSELPQGIGRGGFLGVTYRQNRPQSPWLARYQDCTLGSYASAYEAAVARWICSRYDRDVWGRDGTWNGCAYEKQGGTLIIKRFKESTEEGVIEQIDRHFHIDRSSQTPQNEAETGESVGNAAASPPLGLSNPAASHFHMQTTSIEPSLPPANPRRCPLPTELPRTGCRGEYHGVVYDKGRYRVTWRTQYLGSYDTAFEAGLAWYIAEHFDRDIEQDKERGFRARAYKRPAIGEPKGRVLKLYAATEAEIIRLVDEYHGIVRPESSSEVEASCSSSSSASATLLPLLDAIPQYVDELWKRYSVRDGRAVCEELYKCWLLFLSQRRLSHLLLIDLKTWQAKMEKLLGLTLVRAPIAEEDQAMSLPADCLVPRTRMVFRLQWEMVMTSMCTPEVCMAVWEKRRRAAARQSVYVQQAGITEEVRERALLMVRFPLWTDDWTPPTILSEEELEEAAWQQVQALELHQLKRLVEREPDNTAAGTELRMRMKGL